MALYLERLSEGLDLCVCENFFKDIFTNSLHQKRMINRLLKNPSEFAWIIG